MLNNSDFIDMETNKGTHSENMVVEMHRYLSSLPHFNCTCQTCNNLKPQQTKG